MAVLSDRSVAWLSGRVAQIAAEAVLIAASIVLYFGVRGLITTRIGVAYENAERIVGWEQAAGVFVEPRLQSALAEHSTLNEILGAIYIYGHWPVLLSTLLWVLIRHREAYRLFRNAMLISGMAGVVIFALFPVAPPRFLPTYGFVDTVAEQTPAYRVLQPPMFVNQYAAVPSLHLGWNLLMGIAVITLAGHRVLRWFGALMPLLMLAAIVLTGNHYLFDGLAGTVLALLALLVARAWQRRRRPPVDRARHTGGEPTRGGGAVSDQAFEPGQTMDPPLGSPVEAAPELGHGLEYDLAHEASAVGRAEPRRDSERGPIATATPDYDGDYSYDLAHDVPK
jgi:membrane-associated phospholipid phosphatase